MKLKVCSFTLSEEALDILGCLSPADCDEMSFEDCPDVDIQFVNDKLVIFMSTSEHALQVVKNRYEMIFKSRGVKTVWQKTDGAGRMGPFEASSVVSLSCALDSLSAVFDRSMTLEEIESIIYDCLSEVVACPTCKGLGKLAHDIYCNRCAGTGYLYIQEC